MFWQTKHAKSREWNERNSRISPQREERADIGIEAKISHFSLQGEGELFIACGGAGYTKRATGVSGSLLHILLLRGILELLFVVPICGQHAQVAAVAPLSVLLSSVEELSSLLWVLLHHTGETNLTLQVVLELIPLWLFAIQ